MYHDRINIESLSISCGVKGLNRISADHEENLYAIATSLYHPARGAPCAFFVASDINDGGTNTHRLLENVKARGFGVVEESEPEDNPKTGNTIVVYTWKINHVEFKKWYSKTRAQRLQKVGV